MLLLAKQGRLPFGCFIRIRRFHERIIRKVFSKAFSGGNVAWMVWATKRFVSACLYARHLLGLVDLKRMSYIRFLSEKL